MARRSGAGPASTSRPARSAARAKAQPSLSLSEPNDGDSATAEAILKAAAELFTTTNPSKVTLRSVAERAGVNYGLIHRHFRTKDALLAALFRRLTAYGTTHIQRSKDAIEATEHLFAASAGGFASLFASVALEGVDPSRVFGDQSALEAYAKLIGEGRTQSSEGRVHPTSDPRLVAGFLMLNIMVWDLYAPYVRELVDTDRPLSELRNDVLHILQRCAETLGAATTTG